MLIFMNGENIDNILQNTVLSQSFSSNFFGNIGRCLWLLGQHSKALICYFKSFNLLIKENTEKTIMNMGYACVWIAETALQKNDERSAIYFLKNCFLNWDKIAPVKAQKIRKDFSELLNKEENSLLLVTVSSLDVEKY